VYMATTKLSLVGHTPAMPDPSTLVLKEPDWTPAVVISKMGATFLGMYQDIELAPYFASVNNETAVRGGVPFDQAHLVEVAIDRYETHNSVKIAEKDFAKISKGLNQWMKSLDMSRTVRRAVAKQAALAALPVPQAAE
jgi:hypothetical protein